MSGYNISYITMYKSGSVPKERTIPTPTNATANSDSIPATTAIAAAVTIGGIPASMIETLTDNPESPGRRQPHQRGDDKLYHQDDKNADQNEILHYGWLIMYFLF